MTQFESFRVLVTPTTFALYDPGLREQLEETVGEVIYNTHGRPLRADELIEAIPGSDGFIAGLDEITRQVLEAADRLKVIARYGVGVDNVALEAARELGIVVTNTPGANAVSVAELTLGLMLSLARSIPTADRATRSGEWPRLQGRTLQNKVIGLIGLGAVGGAVARRLRGFDCNVLAHDPYVRRNRARQLGVQLVPLEELVPAADFLSLHCPVTPETRGVVTAEFLSAMKPGAYLVNTARGELVDELALAEALRKGHLAGAGLDTFRSEPPDVENPLFGLEEAIFTPHTGAHTDGAANAMGHMAVQDCLAVLAGKPPENPVLQPQGSQPA